MSVVVVLCFFKQKTAYEMRISGWSSDVCSSDLGAGAAFRPDTLRRKRNHSDKSAAQANARQEAQRGEMLEGFCSGAGEGRHGRDNQSDDENGLTSMAICQRPHHQSSEDGSDRAGCETLPAVGGRSEEHTSDIQSL